MFESVEMVPRQLRSPLDAVFARFEADLADHEPSFLDGPALGLTQTPGADLGDILEDLTTGAESISDLDDDGLVSMVVAAERLGRWAAAVRGDGVLALWERWAHHHDPTDLPDHLEPRHRCPPRAEARAQVARARRLRTVARNAGRSTNFLSDASRVSDDELDAAEQVERAELAESFVAVEVSLACGVSKTAARTWLDVARTLATPDRLPITAHALRTGSLDWPKTLETVRATAPLSTAAAAAVETLVVPRATLPDPTISPADTHPVDEVELRTVPALREALTAAILTIDPDGAADRAATARRARRVLIYPLDEVMGRLTADLPLADCAQISAILDTAAATARANHDPRSSDQVRADTLVDLLLDGGQTTAALAEALLTPDPSDGAPHTPADQPQPDPADQPADSDPATDPGPTPKPTSTSGPGRVPVHVTVVIDLETLLGLRDDPGYLERYGPIAADMARDLATHGTWRCAAIDDTHATILGLGHSTYRPHYTPGVDLQRLTQATYRRCARPGCGARASSCDLDHIHPWPEGPTCSCNAHPLCRRDHRLKTTGLLQVQPSVDPRHPPGTTIWTTRTGRRYLAAPPTPLPETPESLLHAWRAEHRNRHPAPEPRPPAVTPPTPPTPRPADHDPPPF